MSIRLVFNLMAGLQPIILLVCVLVTSASAGRAQTVPVGAPATQAHGNEVLAELRKLRIEILEYRIENRAESLERLEQALSLARNERLRFQDEESARAQQIAETETYLAAQAQSLTPEQRTHFEALKAGMMAPQAEKVRSENSLLEKREAEAQERLRAAHQQLQELKAKRNELMAR